MAGQKSVFPSDYYHFISHKPAVKKMMVKSWVEWAGTVGGYGDDGDGEGEVCSTSTLSNGINSYKLKNESGDLTQSHLKFVDLNPMSRIVLNLDKIANWFIDEM